MGNTINLHKWLPISKKVNIKPTEDEGHMVEYSSFKYWLEN
jgi:hypothetical protein